MLNIGTRALVRNGKYAIQDFEQPKWQPGPVLGGPGPILKHPGVPTAPTPAPPTPKPEPLPQHPVCILGAGAAGLYIAMILDDLDIDYELMEGSGRTGGRLYTHKFPKNTGDYQYYDVGAMRYPKTPFMKRIFSLVDDLSLQMLPYLRANDNAFLSYNGRSFTKSTVNSNAGYDTFGVSKTNGGCVPDEWVQKGSGEFWKRMDVLRKYFDGADTDQKLEEALEKLMKWEDHSVTTYLTLVEKVPYNVVKWWETMESRTGLFDQALVETVLASLVFMAPNMEDNVDWKCFDGGSEILHKAMRGVIRTQPQHYMRAVAIEESEGGRLLTVTFDSRHHPDSTKRAITKKKYSHVISTMSFGCLRMVDLHDILSPAQRDAIRQLTYTPSIKIGLQFKSAWWEKLSIVGGQSSTDRPIRDVVYPSYGPDSSHPNNQKSNCMISSYNGMQDSQRLGGLMKGKDSSEEKVLLDLVMRDLAAVHNVDVGMIQGELEDHHAWDFHRDEFQLGAFCQFGPGQFKNTYPFVTQPASKRSRFHFAGDGTSTFHGWVAGALNSGWRAVYEMLLTHPKPNDPNEDDKVELAEPTSTFVQASFKAPSKAPFKASSHLAPLTPPQLKEDPNQGKLKKFVDKWGMSDEWEKDVLQTHVITYSFVSREKV